MRKLRILTLMHKDLVPPDNYAELSPEEADRYRTEHDVTSTLAHLGHNVVSIGVKSDLNALREGIREHNPHILFNLLEEFDGEAVFDQNVVAYLELLRKPFTGCGSRGLLLARDKALSKQVLSYHRIRVPDFAVFPRGRSARRPPRLRFPLFVKSLNEEASLGISQASIVYDDERLQERVQFIHERIGTDAIAEQYIEGRELYVGVLGTYRLQVLPVWELIFSKMPEDMPKIATAKVKWDANYQEKWGITSQRAEGLPEGIEDRISHLAKRIYRCLGLTGYARIDLRMTPAGELYVLEANPNPQLAYGEDFAESAHAVGIEYGDLLQRIVNIGLRTAQPAHS